GPGSRGRAHPPEGRGGRRPRRRALPRPAGRFVPVQPRGAEMLRPRPLPSELPRRHRRLPPREDPPLTRPAAAVRGGPPPARRPRPGSGCNDFAGFGEYAIQIVWEKAAIPADFTAPGAKVGPTARRPPGRHVRRCCSMLRLFTVLAALAVACLLAADCPPAE